jgi:NTE family protein
MSSADRPRSGFGLVMAGGAARGAYQAGVLRYLIRDLPRQLGYVPWPDLVSGTSVGSLNGVFAAARQPAGVDRLLHLWQTLSIPDVYRFGRQQIRDFLTAPFDSDSPFALLDGGPFAKLIDREFPHRALRDAIDSGRTRAFIVSATELATGNNALFVDSTSEGRLVQPRPQSMVHHQRIQPIHLVASASIPFVFRPVEIDGHWLVDGGLRMNTPLRPVLRAGVDRVLVVSLLQGSPVVPASAGHKLPPPELPHQRAHVVVPNLFFLGGKTFNALLLDPVERDVHTTRRLNDLIAWGNARYGPDFARALADEQDVHHVDTLFLRPSEDLGEMAAQLYRSQPPKASLPVRYLLSRIVDENNRTEADLLSYLFFDRVFTGAVEALGYEDAKRNEARLVELIGAEPAGQSKS